MGSFKRAGKPNVGFNRDDRKKSFGGDRKFSGRDRDDDRGAMFKATCAECGKDCEVPFKPTGGRPVYCSNCFDKQGGGDRERRPSRFDGGRRERPRFEDKQMYRAVCAECGKDCEVPFRPTNNKPVYCSNCFDKQSDGGTRAGSRSGGGNSDFREIIEQIRKLNVKFDTLVEMLAPNASIGKKDKAKKEIIEDFAEIKEAAVKVKKEKKIKAEPKKIATKKKK